MRTNILSYDQYKFSNSLRGAGYYWVTNAILVHLKFHRVSFKCDGNHYSH